MKLFIPELGTKLTLIKPWTFTVLNESRNRTLAKLLGVKSSNPRYPLGAQHYDTVKATGSRSAVGGGWEPYRYEYKLYRPIKRIISHTYKAGTQLVVDRIYIRKGAKDFSSLTFKTRFNGKVIRFFAKLEDVNKIEFN